MQFILRMTVQFCILVITTMIRSALVTGANGFIGSHLVHYLLQQGLHVRCLVRTSSNLRWLKAYSVEYVYGDLTEISSLHQAVEKVDLVFHLAGKTKAKDKSVFFSANAQGTENLLQAVYDVNPNILRFVYVSSIAAAGPSSKDRPHVEEDMPNPVTIYGKSKLEGEQKVWEFKEKIQVTVVRPPVVFGPRDEDVLRFFRLVDKGILPRLGCKDQYAGFVYVEDLVKGLFLAAVHPHAVGQLYYLATEGNFSWDAFGKCIANVLHRRVISIPVPLWIFILSIFVEEMRVQIFHRESILNLQKLPEYRNRFWTCSIEKAKKELGFQPEWTMESAIEKTVQWYKEFGYL